ncbi:unnamed protein product [Cyprideis torosa]|uniref:proline--tRNA ligase n=1 Tax=Cyprideis torosa TaxID=163714 RepID=A0A7R8W3I8_9CRUS|nr:unnamed protein product [Cyprideis torosa]CAG0878950.1 unnamed protein product [Cyprideis torosa]
MIFKEATLMSRLFRPFTATMKVKPEVPAPRESVCHSAKPLLMCFAMYYPGPGGGHGFPYSGPGGYGSPWSFVALSQLANDSLLQRFVNFIAGSPRVVGSSSHRSVREFIAKQLQDSGYIVVIERHSEQIPLVDSGLPRSVEFASVVATLNPQAERQIVLAAHYDTLYRDKNFSRRFVGASDSAVPCAMILFMGVRLAPILRQILPPSLSLQLVFFDGEEAFRRWSQDDSIYGARYLANVWSQRPHPVRPEMPVISGIEFMMLLDVLGTELGCTTDGSPALRDVKFKTKNITYRLASLEVLLREMDYLEVYGTRCRRGERGYFKPDGDQGVQDDHLPFLAKGVPIVHLIPTPFPSTWHTLGDDLTAINMLLLENSYVFPTGSGTYAYLPLGQMVLQKLVHQIDEAMADLDAQKVLFPAFCNASLWKKSGRWEGPRKDVFTFVDRNQHEFILNPTHEEPVTDLISHFKDFSYRGLPLRLYQITSKFRDEMRPVHGLLRAKEFLMKDLYTFDESKEAARETYQQVLRVYRRFFRKLGLRVLQVTGDPGNIGGSASDEFHIINPVGEDTLQVCGNCGLAVNAGELGLMLQCSKCDAAEGKQTEKGIEVAHAFLLEQKYSEPMQAKFVTSEKETEHTRCYEMGCFGIGVSRLMAAIVETNCLHHSEADCIRWPDVISPFLLALVPAKDGSREEAASSSLLSTLSSSLSPTLRFILHRHVIIDDRAKLTIGRRMRDIKTAGIAPYLIVAGKSTAEGKLELVHRGETIAEGKPQEILEQLEDELKSSLLMNDSDNNDQEESAFIISKA